MVVLTMTFLACWLAMVTAPATPIARGLHRLLVAAPAARLSAIGRADVAIALVVVAAVIVMTGFAEGDLARMVMVAVPDVAIWLTTLEVSACIDVLVAVAAGVSALRRGSLRAILPMVSARRAARARRSPGVTRMLPANDDEDRTPLPLAA